MTSSAKAPNGVQINGIDGYNNVGPGLYFDVDSEAWNAYFGSLVSGGTYQVKQCYGAESVWDGDAVIGHAYGEWYGRRLEGQAAGQWNIGDIIVRPGDVCPRPDGSYCDDIVEPNGCQSGVCAWHFGGTNSRGVNWIKNCGKVADGDHCRNRFDSDRATGSDESCFSGSCSTRYDRCM